jgi:hypothetical protein
MQCEPCCSTTSENRRVKHEFLSQEAGSEPKAPAAHQAASQELSARPGWLGLRSGSPVWVAGRARAESIVLRHVHDLVA